MPLSSDLAALDPALRELLAARSPLVSATSPLPHDLPLGAGGLGLDSIALAELVLECEERFGLASAAEILAGPPLTVGGLAAALRASVSV
jgi:hypothetical protein